MAIYKRILLKLSGESLMGSGNYGIDPMKLMEYSLEIKSAISLGVQISIVIGGGNIFRGMQGFNKGFDRVKADSMGMLATCINALAISSSLDSIGVKNKVLTSVCMEPIAEYYSPTKAREYMSQGFVVIIAGGTGNPYFTTDTGSALRGIEIQADVMLKGTRVDGIYTKDPEKDPMAQKFDEITYIDVIDKNLRVMDLTATTLCMENNLPIIVFNMDKENNLTSLLKGDKIGTIVK